MIRIIVIVYSGVRGTLISETTSPFGEADLIRVQVIYLLTYWLLPGKGGMDPCHPPTNLLLLIGSVPIRRIINPILVETTIYGPLSCCPLSISKGLVVCKGCLASLVQ